MSAFLYFAPDRIAAAADVAALGLGYAFEGASPDTVQTTRGPGGGLGGTVFCVPSAEPPLFVEKEQTWAKGPGGKYWVGFRNDGRPGPDDLRRKRFVAGEAVELGDGKLWTVPIARSIVRGSSLPQALALGEDGQTWEMRELPEFARICADAEKVWEAFAGMEMMENGRGVVKIDLDETIRVALAALAVNYRVGPMEVSLLGLLSTTNRWDILKALVDYVALERAAEAQQKKSLQPDT